MEVRLLGPVGVWTEAGAMLPRRRQECQVLAALALDAGRLVLADVLLDRVWGVDPPAQARRCLYTHVSRIRALLETDRDGPDTPIRLVRHSGGYLLDADPERVDLLRLRSLSEEANAAPSAQARSALLREAISLWRGEPLAGLPGEWFAAVRQGAWDQYLSAAAALADLEVELGRPESAITDLQNLVADHPLVENLTAALMRALLAAGRRAEALECYATLRRRLVDELGIEPGWDVQAVHRAVLRGDQAIAGTRPQAGPVRDVPGQGTSGQSTPGQGVPGQEAPGQGGPGAVGSVTRARSTPRPVPRQLPGDVHGFTGRVTELAALDALLLPALVGPTAPADPAASTAVTIATVSGTAGVGKTALCVQWANRALPRFPDGQLYLNLRGYDPDQPMQAGEGLAGLLTGLGLAAHDIPLGEAERAARFRTETANRRMLLLLDNASSPEQVRPLVPGPGCAVIVTSRDALTGLVARDGAWRLELDLLPPPDAVALLRRLIGARADAEPEATGRLAEQCSRLPLALRLVAELANARPGVPLHELADQLDDHRRRLDRLDAGGDSRTAVRSVFSWSVSQLPEPIARAFGVLGSHPGPDFDHYAAAALLELDVLETERILDRLVRAHLVQVTERGRYGMHDLLRAYAQELTRSAEPPDASQAGQPCDRHPRAALQRLLDYYLLAVARAVDTVFPSDNVPSPDVPPAGIALPALSDPGRARAWLDAELPALVSASGFAAVHGWDTFPVRLSPQLFRYVTDGRLHEGLVIHHQARDAAIRLGDPLGQARALNGLGAVYWLLGRYQDAIRDFEDALRLFRDAGDVRGQMRVLGNLGAVEERMGRHREAAEHLLQALELPREPVTEHHRANVMINLGILENRLGRPAVAMDHQSRALEIYRMTGDRGDQAYALNNLGDVAAGMGDLETATRYLDEAVTLCRDAGERSGEAYATLSLGDVAYRRRDLASAEQLHADAIAIFRELGDAYGQCWCLNSLGETAIARDAPAEAAGRHAAALDIAAGTDAADQQARAHAGLGHAHRTGGDPQLAREHYRAAIGLYRELGRPEAEELQPLLAPLSSSP